MRKTLIVPFAAVALILAQTSHAAGPAGLPADKLQRAYVCAGILWAELGKDTADVKAANTMDRAAVNWLEEAAHLGGEVPDEGTSLPAIDASYDAYLARPDKAQLRYCIANAPKRVAFTSAPTPRPWSGRSA